MPSPFPGMDPFIEMQEWPDFHTTYMTVIRELLTPQVRPRYVVRVERREYLEQLPEAEEHREYFLVLRDRETLRIVTLIELLSPSNKRAGSDGREQYLDKREEVVQSQTNLVELDLLRGGQRLPMQTKLPEGDYYALVRRGWHRRRVSVYAWTLRQKMPPIPIPLQKDEPEPTLDLQAALDQSYDRAAYQDSLDYSQALQPPARPEEADWIKELLSADS